MAVKIEVGDFCVQYVFCITFLSLLHRSANLQGGNDSVPSNRLKVHVFALFEMLVKGKFVLLKKGTCQMFEDGIFMHNFMFLKRLHSNTRVPDVSHLKLGPNQCHVSISFVDLFYIFVCFTTYCTADPKMYVHADLWSF